MSETLGEAVLVIRTNDSGFDAGISRNRAGAERLGQSFDRTANQASAMGQDLTRAGQTAAGVGNRFEQAGQQVVRSSNMQRAGMQQLSFQLGDMSTMFAMGARPMQIFASQGGQIIQAVQMMTGGTSRLAAFLGGPWGIAITSAAMVLAPLIGNLLSTGEAADGARGALQQLTDARRADFEEQTRLGRAQNELNGLLERQRALQEEIERVSGGKLQGDGRTPMFAYRQYQELQDVQRQIEEGNAGILGETVRRRGPVLQRQRAAAASAASAENAAAARAAAAATREVAAAEREANREREAAARELERQTEAADRYIASLEDEYARLTLSAEEYRQREISQHRAAAATDEQRASIDRLAASIAAANALEAESNRLKELQTKTEEADQRYQDKIKELADEQRRLGEQQITYLANLYETLFSDGVGGVWKQFKRQGLAAIAQIAAQWALSMMNGKGGGLGGIIQQVLGQGGQGGLGSLFGNQSNAALFAGFFADGGLIPNGQFGIVGERGPELAIAGAAGTTVLPSAAFAGGSGGGAPVVRLQVTRGEMFDVAVQEISGRVSVEVLRANGPALAEGAAAETMRQLTRDRM